MNLLGAALIGYIEGRLLVIVDAPCAEAMFAMGNANNAFCMTRADVDNGITDVTETGDYRGEINRENYPPPDAGDLWSIPFVVASPETLGWDTRAITVNTRNTRDWPGPYLAATFTYQGWKADGTTLEPYEAVESAGASTVLPGHRQLISALPPQGYNGMTGRAVVITNSANSHGMIWYASENDLVTACQYEINSGDGPDNLATVWDGQYNAGTSKPVEHGKKTKRGALTVANLNNTDDDKNPDGSLKIDKDDTDVPGEKDLIRVVINKPADMLENAKVKIEFPSGAGKVEVWKEARKNNNKEAAREFGPTDFNAAGEKEIWIEGLDKSGALRDVELTISYTGKDGKVKSDTISITFVWAAFTRFRNTPSGKVTTLNPDATWKCNEADITGLFASACKSYMGIITINPPGIRNVMEMEFQVFPPAIKNLSGVAFDITRMAEGISGTINAAGAYNPIPGGQRTWPLGDENANDDYVDPAHPADHNIDNQNEPNSDLIYSIDGPGIGTTVIPDAEFIMRANFMEFVRVRFDFTEPSGNGVNGSRCSDGVRWRSIIYTKNSGVGNVHIRNIAAAAQFGNPAFVGQDPPPAGWGLENNKEAKNFDAKTEDWTLTYKGSDKWSVHGSTTGNLPDATTNVIYESDAAGIKFQIKNAAYQQYDKITFSTVATQRVGATATTPVAVDPNPGTMTAVTVYDATTMSEDWTVEYIGDGKWTVTGTHSGLLAKRAETDVQYSYENGRVSFKINPNQGYANNHKFTFKTRRARENEIKLEPDQSTFEKPIETY